MSQKSKTYLIFLLMVCLSASGAYYYLDSFDKACQKRVELASNSAKLSVLNEKIESFFSGRLVIANFDEIESDFLRARELYDALRMAKQKDKELERFEKLYVKKDRYKALLSQALMSYLFVKKYECNAGEYETKRELYLEMSELFMEKKRDLSVLEGAILKAEEVIKDEPLVSHAQLFLKNVREIYQLSGD